MLKWRHISFILGSPISRKILEALNASERPLAPVQLSKKADIAQSNISTRIGVLAKEGLVRCINPDARKWRFYEITREGRDVLDEVKKTE
ncbi:MAG: helix-turn-helix domain-containing protein [Nanoarchaeota archaeon]